MTKTRLLHFLCPSMTCKSVRTPIVAPRCVRRRRMNASHAEKRLGKIATVLSLKRVTATAPRAPKPARASEEVMIEKDGKLEAVYRRRPVLPFPMEVDLSPEGGVLLQDPLRELLVLASCDTKLDEHHDHVKQHLFRIMSGVYFLVGNETSPDTLPAVGTTLGLAASRYMTRTGFHRHPERGRAKPQQTKHVKRIFGISGEPTWSPVWQCELIDLYVKQAVEVDVLAAIGIVSCHGRARPPPGPRTVP